MLLKNWDEDRKKEICIPVQPFKPTVETFKSIPIGDTDMDIDLSTCRMPGRVSVNYEENANRTPTEVR